MVLHVATYGDSLEKASSSATLHNCYSRPMIALKCWITNVTINSSVQITGNVLNEWLYAERESSPTAPSSVGSATKKQMTARLLHTHDSVRTVVRLPSTLRIRHRHWTTSCILQYVDSTMLASASIGVMPRTLWAEPLQDRQYWVQYVQYTGHRAYVLVAVNVPTTVHKPYWKLSWWYRCKTRQCATVHST